MSTEQKTQDSPQNTEIQEKDLPDLPFKPNRCFFIAKHTGLTQQIGIYDITSDVDLSNYTTGEGLSKWGQEAMEKGAAREKEGLPPFMHMNRNNWYGKTFNATKPSADGKDEHVADWNGGIFSSSKNKLSFPDGSNLEDLLMKTDSYLKFRDGFVVDSVPYLWSVLKYFGLRQFRLTRTLAGDIATIARFWESRFQLIVQGGILVVDDKELDAVLAILTCMVMIRKQRLKWYEYS